MAIRIGDDAPDFTATTTEGTIHFHEWVGDKWAILFSHPKDFTPVCTTELGYMARLKPEFDATGGKRTAADNATVRSVFVIGPDKKVKAMIVYPMSTGRNFDEVLRLLDSVQLTARHTVATPVNWKPGQDVIIPASVSDDDAKKKYPQGFKTHKPYLRTVRQPQ